MSRVRIWGRKYSGSVCSSYEIDILNCHDRGRRKILIENNNLQFDVLEPQRFSTDSIYLKLIEILLHVTTLIIIVSVIDVYA